MWYCLNMEENESHLRVSNIDKLLPGLSVSDSWKRIFPGTLMSNRWILKKEMLKDKEKHSNPENVLW